MQYYVYNRPENKIHHENPVRFTWYPLDEVTTYDIVVYDENHLEAYTFKDIDMNFYTPSLVMKPGAYTYSVFAKGKAFVEKQPFELAKDAVETPLPERQGRYKAIGQHPRIWLNQDDIQSLKISKEDTLKEVWDKFEQDAVLPWTEIDVKSEPARYPNDVKVLTLWRQMYIDCQEVLYTVKHNAVAWSITGNKLYLETAKKWLLAAADFDVEGSTARSYNDEASFRITSALAWGYDWLYEDLTDLEKAKIKTALLHRGRELYHYVKEDIQIHVKLLDSHGVRSLSMTLIPAALALYGEEPEAKQWLDYTLEYFFTIFTPWGGEDGGWAEGPAYWQTGISLFTEAICLIQKAIGINIFNRPFFQNTGDFPLFTYAQDLRFMAFGDQSDLGDYPGLKAGYTMRILSAVSDSPNREHYAWYYDQAKVRGVGTENRFYNYGWWNFDFDELFFQMLFKPIIPKAPEKGLMVKHFENIGWVCLHKDMAEEENHVAFMFKSSPYGSVSHSHGDQNAFVLHAFGEPLLIQSGYYVGFRSDMHIKWRRETKSKNAILINHTGQYCEMNKATAAEILNGSAKSQFDQLIGAKGSVEVCNVDQDVVYIEGDATKAFSKTVPDLISYKRKIVCLRESLFVVMDEVELKDKGTIDWLLHSLEPFDLKDNAASLKVNKACLDVYFMNQSMVMDQTNSFENVDPNEYEGLPTQWHFKATTTEEATSFNLITLLYPYKEGEKKSLVLLEGSDSRVIFDGQSYQLADLFL